MGFIEGREKLILVDLDITLPIPKGELGKFQIYDNVWHDKLRCLYFPLGATTFTNLVTGTLRRQMDFGFRATENRELSIYELISDYFRL